uniref:Glucose-1-phosphate adenylyltransferase n=1 Tax=Candidatus Kentrum eta TaxID=2126337 RepID=A0A450USR1_9GAMM|nr:MAG: glucose-1-phosphate adenylyltransferase [Candidatus Kentron sp. H]VFJ96366.1 MAG: glucose-1-phosphate adenylyltransferase [Candidatus Kentron sp. H]VFK02247.1 MAG: glucose-1-phosphate adenylyltransferase [Candidatus Kentron sp. H]
MTNMLSDVLCVILGGGRGSRLWPLTKSRAKPAVPIGGKYRLIDIPLSNCLHSGMNRIAVLTQFNSVSLHRHIAQTYHFGLFDAGWVQILAAEQTSSISDWYQGTADAVRKQLPEILAADTGHVLILSGDQLYRMDYSRMFAQHLASEADITVAVKPVSREDASRFGILKEEAEGRIVDFVEKPQDETVLKDFICGARHALPYLGSMGIYLFRTRALVELLDSRFIDFGGHLIPSAIPAYRIMSHTFTGYWEDIGTIRSFFDANLDLVALNPEYNFFHDAVHPIYTRPRFLPGCRLYDVRLDRVLLGDGCIVAASELHNTLVGNRTIIGQGAVIRDAVLMGADYYEGEVRTPAPDVPPIGIGDSTRIDGAIIDKNARIGSSVRIGPFPRGTDLDAEQWAVRDGIVVVPKNTIISDGTVISP